jgi:hypothetical protein
MMRVGNLWVRSQFGVQGSELTSPIHIDTFPCVSQPNTLELLLYMQHLMPCSSLPTINHVDKRSLLITILLISTGFDNVKITTVDKHRGVASSGHSDKLISLSTSSPTQWCSGCENCVNPDPTYLAAYIFGCMTRISCRKKLTIGICAR